MAIPGVGAAGVGAAGGLPFQPPSVSSSPAAKSAEPSAFAKGLEAVSKLETNADQLGAKVATGSLTDVHDFTTAAAKASLAVSLTAALRNRAVEAYQEIMRMQV